MHFPYYSIDSSVIVDTANLALIADGDRSLIDNPPMEPFPVGFDHVKVKFSGSGTSLLTLTLPPSSSLPGEYFVFCLPLPQRNGRR